MPTLGELAELGAEEWLVLEQAMSQLALRKRMARCLVFI
jgi:hypothetical protein